MEKGDRLEEICYPHSILLVSVDHERRGDWRQKKGHLKVSACVSSSVSSFLFFSSHLILILFYFVPSNLDLRSASQSGSLYFPIPHTPDSRTLHSTTFPSSKSQVSLYIFLFPIH